MSGLFMYCTFVGGGKKKYILTLWILTPSKPKWRYGKMKIFP